MPTDKPRVVVVHDYLTQRGGAERVALALMRALDGAVLVTSCFEPEQTYPEFAQLDVRTMWLNRVAAFRRDPRKAVPFLAAAFGSVRLDAADAVVCSSSAFAHRVRTSAPKIVYCHNPPRFLYQPADYFRGLPRPAAAATARALQLLCAGDRDAARSATLYVANSRTVRERVRRTYGIEATVVPPPVLVQADGHRQPVAGVTAGFVLTVSRSRGYKGTELVCRAIAAMPDQQLVVVGDLPPTDGAWPRNLRAVRNVSDAQLRWLYANCSMLVAAGREDFGLTPLEANAFGRPVVALPRGGYLETCLPGRTAVFAEDATAPAIRSAVRAVAAAAWDEPALVRHAKSFGEDVFARRMRELVDDVVTDRRLVRVPAQLTRSAALR